MHQEFGEWTEQIAKKLIGQHAETAPSPRAGCPAIYDLIRHEGSCNPLRFRMPINPTQAIIF